MSLSEAIRKRIRYYLKQNDMMSMKFENVPKFFKHEP